MAQSGATAEVLPGPRVNDETSRQAVPFRKATTERAGKVIGESGVIHTASAKRFERDIEGSGFMYGVLLDMNFVTSANAATVAFAEDGPYSALDSVVLRDVNAELVNLQGFDLYVANLAGKQYIGTYPSDPRSGSAAGATFVSNNPLYTATTGSGGTGGTFRFLMRVPVGINRRDLVGIVGNQDRAQKYSLRNDLAASGSVFTTPPTTLSQIGIIDRYYENYSVPTRQASNSVQQQVVPDFFGTLHFLTSFFSEALPTGSATMNHFLRRIGNTIRFLALIFRSNGSRATADTNAPTSLILKVGEDTLFTETWIYRRFLMNERYGFEYPNGIIVYDMMHDFNGEGSGGELGDDYWHTQALVNAQLLAAYPSGYGSTANSLKVITDDLIYVTPQ
jgi:hypothetical protein